MSHTRAWCHGLLLLSLLWPYAAVAEFRVDVRQGAGKGIPLVIAPIGEHSRQLTEVVEADLKRSGLFQVLPSKGITWAGSSPIQFDAKQWEQTGAEYVAVAQAHTEGDTIRVAYRLWDIVTGASLHGKQIAAPALTWRRVAHQLADTIHEDLSGIPGAFDTRLAYIRRTGVGRRLRYYLYVADIDGHNSTAILSSPEPLFTPTWSPDGHRLAYVSLERGRQQIYLQDLKDGSRRPLPASQIASSDPAFSPNGKMMTMTITTQGDAEIFLYNLETQALTQLTHSQGIDTEAVWEADGSGIIFTSNRSGKARLYRQAIRGNQAQLLPIPNRYSAAAEVSPNGRYVAFIQGLPNGGYGTFLYEFENGSLYSLSEGALDESPSFAPNSQSLIYAATSQTGEKGLILASYNGIIRQPLEIGFSNIREPAWSPYR